MILVSVMLAIYLGWPLAFGGKQRGLEAPAEARSVAAAPVSTKHTKPMVLAAVSMPASSKPESCYKRYQREVKLCSGEATGAACKFGAADHWDMCEATGFWPN
jgi:hypothetical protein